ncbi:unnamed protein product [Ceratitis capitata]|uniref:(Mediterranean fruit fly) hypothetical protein n=1 Tax=Ceratitis capitata TaxID=7213 RepID=A0A811UL50_CERCA|nr:unnamed protein product [Ceratitis capitata]
MNTHEEEALLPKLEHKQGGSQRPQVTYLQVQPDEEIGRKLILDFYIYLLEISVDQLSHKALEGEFVATVIVTIMRS